MQESKSDLNFKTKPRNLEENIQCIPVIFKQDPMSPQISMIPISKSSPKSFYGGLAMFESDLATERHTCMRLQNEQTMLS